MTQPPEQKIDCGVGVGCVFIAFLTAFAFFVNFVLWFGPISPNGSNAAQHKVEDPLVKTLLNWGFITIPVAGIAAAVLFVALWKKRR